MNKKSWNYATLTKTAKQFGGPEKFIETIKQQAFSQGANSEKIKQIPIALVSFVAGLAICKIYSDTKDK